VIIRVENPDVNNSFAESIDSTGENLHRLNFHIIQGSGGKGAYKYAVLLFFLTFTVEAVDCFYGFRFFLR